MLEPQSHTRSPEKESVSTICGGPEALKSLEDCLNRFSLEELRMWKAWMMCYRHLGPRYTVMFTMDLQVSSKHSLFFIRMPFCQVFSLCQRAPNMWIITPFYE